MLKPGLPFALAAIGVAVAAVRLRSFVLLNDEGLVLEAAARIGRGEWPYQDFWWTYGPGQPLLLAALEPLTGGPSLLTWRLVLVVVQSLTALTAFELVRRHTSLPWALAAWAATLVLVVVPRLPNPNAPAALLGLAVVLVAPAHPRLAGGLAGVSTLLRPEFGIVVVLAAVIGAGRRGAARAAATAGISAVVVWLPFAVAAGPGAILEQTFLFDLGAQRMQRLPIFTAPPDGAAGLDVLHHYLPALLFVCATLAIAATAWLALRRLATPTFLAVLSLVIGGAAYLAGRADLYHVVPLAAVLPAALALLPTLVPQRRSRSAAAIACGGLLALFLVDGVARRIDVVRTTPPTAEAPGPAGDGVRMGEADAGALSRIKLELDRRLPHRSIWVANARHDRITSSASLAYILLDRASVTRYPVLQPGVVTEADAQREIAKDLSAARVPVVRWLGVAGAAPEPNPSGRASRSRMLDRFLERSYRVELSPGDWQLLLPAQRP